MRRIMLVLVSLFVSTIALQNVYAQQTSCNVLMNQYGIYDRFDTLSERSQFRLFKSWVCGSKFSSYDEAIAAATALGMNRDIFDQQFGNSNAKTQWLTWSAAFCNAEFDAVKGNLEYKEKIRVATNSLVNAISKCIDSQPKGRFYGWIETTENRSQFTFKARYLPEGNEKTKVLTFNIKPESVMSNCNHDEVRLLKSGQKFNGIRSVTCTVDPKETVTVSINTTKGQANPVLEPFIPRPTAEFAVTNTEITSGQAVDFSWTTKNADSVSIQPIIVGLGASGRFTTPLLSDSDAITTRTFTLVASGEGGIIRKFVAVKIKPIPNPPSPPEWTSDPSFQYTCSLDLPAFDGNPGGRRLLNKQCPIETSERIRIVQVLVKCENTGSFNGCDQTWEQGSNTNLSNTTESHLWTDLVNVNGGKGIRINLDTQVNQLDPIRVTYTIKYEVHRR